MPQKENVPPMSLKEAAIDATRVIVEFYGADSPLPFKGVSTVTYKLTNAETVERLNELACDLNEGYVNSHRDIAKVVRSIGPKLAVSGLGSEEIYMATLSLAVAIYNRKGTFDEDIVEKKASISAKTAPYRTRAQLRGAKATS